MQTAQTENCPPLAIAVAPNGARRSQTDHQALPISPSEIAATAALCQQAGASLLHLHVRDGLTHSLDPGLYAEAIAAVRSAVGNGLVIQMTTEAVGRYSPEEQMAAVRAVRPEAVSVALCELIPDEASESSAAYFLAEMAATGVMVQHILYSAADVVRLEDLRRRAIIPAAAAVWPLFVLGRYANGQRSQPADLLPFLAARADLGADWPWAVCAFGPAETACAMMAIALGGHVRVGFENNMWHPDGRPVGHNADLVGAAAAAGRLLARPMATADDIRAGLPGGIG